MPDHERKKRFVPSERRLYLSNIKEALVHVSILFILGILPFRKDLRNIVFLLILYLVAISIRFWILSRRQGKDLEIAISDQDVYGMPEAPWFTGFRKLEKISIPLKEIDKQRTRLKKSWYSSANLIWSIDGRNIFVSGAFEEEQLREMAGLIGCPVEL